jgi:hypothetical protein
MDIQADLKEKLLWDGNSQIRLGAALPFLPEVNATSPYYWESGSICGVKAYC